MKLLPPLFGDNKLAHQSNQRTDIEEEKDDIKTDGLVEVLECVFVQFEKEEIAEHCNVVEVVDQKMVANREEEFL